MGGRLSRDENARVGHVHAIVGQQVLDRHAKGRPRQSEPQHRPIGLVPFGGAGREPSRKAVSWYPTCSGGPLFPFDLGRCRYRFRFPLLPPNRASSIRGAPQPSSTENGCRRKCSSTRLAAWPRRTPSALSACRAEYLAGATATPGGFRSSPASRSPVANFLARPIRRSNTAMRPDWAAARRPRRKIEAPNAGASDFRTIAGRCSRYRSRRERRRFHGPSGKSSLAVETSSAGISCTRPLSFRAWLSDPTPRSERRERYRRPRREFFSRPPDCASAGRWPNRRNRTRCRPPASFTVSRSSSAPSTETATGRGGSPSRTMPLSKTFLSSTWDLKNRGAGRLAALPLNADFGLKGLELAAEFHDDLAIGVSPSPCAYSFSPMRSFMAEPRDADAAAFNPNSPQLWDAERMQSLSESERYSGSGASAARA